MLKSISTFAAVLLTLGAGSVLPTSAATSVERAGLNVEVAHQLPTPHTKPGKDTGSGNSDAARSCKQGGYLDRFDATTGNAFITAGACVAHAAAGGVQATITLVATSYPCASDPGLSCWGVVVGSGLLPATPVAVFGPELATEPAHVDQSGAVNAEVQIPCTYSQQANFFAVAYVMGTTRISSRDVHPPCPPVG